MLTDWRQTGLQTQRKATAQACKTSGRAPPPKRRAGKGAYDMAARAHASRTGRLRRKECCAPERPQSECSYANINKDDASHAQGMAQLS